MRMIAQQNDKYIQKTLLMPIYFFASFYLVREIFTPFTLYEDLNLSITKWGVGLSGEEDIKEN